MTDPNEQQTYRALAKVIGHFGIQLGRYLTACCRLANAFAACTIISQRRYLTLEHVAEQFFHRSAADRAAEKQVLDAFWRDESQKR